MDCCCYGQLSHENESRTEIKREPFIRAVLVLDKTCSYKWYSSRLIFPRINGPSLKRAKRASLTRPYFQRLSPVSLSVFSLVPDLLFDCSRVLEYAKMRIVLQFLQSSKISSLHTYYPVTEN